MTAHELIQTVAHEFGREASVDDSEYILWEHTGYPSFWHIPRDGNTPEECLRTQVRAFFAALPPKEKP
jgi:hypothetical protein